jgi:hypothetical protein
MATKTTLQKITDKARSIRKANEPWISAVKRASKIVMASLSPSSKSGKQKARRKVGAVKRKPAKRKAAKKKTSNRQTGTSNSFFDRMVTAKAPGKRIVKHKGGKKSVYYERRKNRSDKPGMLTGHKPAAVQSAYSYMIITRMKSNVAQIAQTTTTIEHLKRKMKESKDKVTKRLFANQIVKEKHFLTGLKKDNTNLKRLI